MVMLYELVVRGSYFEQDIINRFNYVSTGIPAAVSGSFGLVSAFGAIPTLGVLPADGVLDTWLDLVSDQYSVVSVTARAASDYDVSDFYELPYATPPVGANTAVALSPASAIGFRTNLVRLDIGRGYKRLVGVTETLNAAGGEIDPTVSAFLNAVAAAFSAVLEYDDEGNTISYTPCVVSKEEYTTTSGKRAYRYYPTLTEQLDHVATGVVWTPYQTVRTQRSRQYGHGG